MPIVENGMIPNVITENSIEVQKNSIVGCTNNVIPQDKRVVSLASCTCNPIWKVTLAEREWLENGPNWSSLLAGTIIPRKICCSHVNISMICTCCSRVLMTVVIKLVWNKMKRRQIVAITFLPKCLPCLWSYSIPVFGVVLNTIHRIKLLLAFRE